MYFFHSEFWTTCACPKKQFVLKFFTVFNVALHFWATYACPEKQSVPWIHCIEYIFVSFRILNNLRLPCKTEFTLKFFTALKYFLSFRIFEQLELALKTEFALKFSSQGGAPPPPRTPLLIVLIYANGIWPSRGFIRSFDNPLRLKHRDHTS